MKEIDYGIGALAAAISKATSAADRLLKCAESISNPTYVVTMEGRELEILAAAHTAGVITLRVKSPFTPTAYEAGLARRLRQEGQGFLGITADELKDAGIDV